MKQKKYKSILSYLLIFAILITFIPVNTSAQEKKAQETEQPEKSKITDIHAAASGAALEALEAAQTVSPPAIGELGITQTPEITPIPTAEQTPEITPIPTAEQTPEITPIPTAEQTPEITPTADPEQTPAEAVPTSAPEFPEQTEKPAEDLYIYDSQTLEQDIICKHLFLMSGSLSLNGHSITVCGDMQQAGGTLYTDGGSISVQGDCNTASGTLSISGKGVLTVTGDMTVGGNSRIVMNDQKSSVVKTMGDLEIRTSEKLQLTNGTLEIGGNLIQSEEAARESIKTAAGFHILFNGKNRQNLSLSHPADTYLGTLDLRNSAGVEAPNELHGYNIIGMEKLHIENNLRLYMEWIKLQQDEILHNNTELYIQYCQLNGYALKVEGNLCIKEAQNIQINRGNLQVDGNLDCTIRDFLQVSNGTARIGGDLGIHSGCLQIYSTSEVTVCGSTNLTGTGSLAIEGENEKTNLSIGGNLAIATTKASNFTRGAIEIGGDINQQQETAGDSLQIKEKFHIILNGKTKQNLSLSHPADTYLGTLDLRNSAGVEAPNELHGYNIIGMEKLHTENNLRLYMEWIKLQQDEILHNNTELYIQYCQLNGYALKVEGNLCIKEAQNIQINRGNLQVDGNLDCTIRDFLQVSNGTARIGGDLGIHSGCLQIYSTSEVTVCGSTNLTGTGSLAIEGENEKTNLSIGGNLAIATTKASNFTRGAIEIGGDINQQQETAGDSLQIKEKFHIILNGKTKQNLSLSHPADTYLGTLDLRNSAGVEAPNELHGYNIIGLDKLHTGETVRLYMENMQLQQDEVLNSNAEFHITYCALNEYTLNIGGNLTIDKGEIFSINKGKLKINGDFDCNMQNTFDIYNGSIQINGNTKIHSGNFRIFNASKVVMNGNASLTDSAGFLMESDYGSPECIIQGEFQIDTLGVSELTGGVLKAGGLTQSTESAYHSLKIDEDFHLVLKGSQKQRLDLPYVKTIPYLDISQSAGVTLVQSFKGTRLDGIEKIENTETFTSQFEENTVQGNGTLNCNLVCKGRLSVDQYKLKINGSFEQNDDVCINNGILEVTGNYLAKEGKLEICGGKTHIHGNTRIKHNAALGMYPKSTEEAGVCPEESYFLSEGNFTTASNNIGTTMTAGTLEVKGNLIQSDSALSYAMNLTGTRLVLSGDTLQQVKINNLLDAVYLCSIDMTGSAGVSFQCGSLYTGGITGWNTIQNKKLFLYNSRIILQQDETYSGSLEIAGGYFDCNGHSFHTEGSLIQWKTVTNINHGTLSVKLDYLLEGASILQMRYADDLLRVGGNFATRSTLNHHSMLTDGRLELCGSFTQEGDACSFDSTGGFTVAFMGKYRSGVHFEDPHDSQFANIDPDYANYYTDDSPLEMAVRLGESILLGMKDSAEEQIEFSSDALVSEVAIAGLSVVTGEAVPFLLLAVTAGFIASDIVDTTESNENMYIKARRYAKDVMDTIIMVSSLKCIRENRTPSESDFQDESLLKKIIRLFQSDDSDSSDFNSAGRLSTFLHISDDMWDLFGEALDADALAELKTIAAGICEEDDAGSVMLRVYNTVVQVREESGADRLDTDDIHVITDRVRDGDAYSLIRDILIVKEKPATSRELYQRICSIGKDASLSHREKYVKMKRLYEAVEDKGDVMFPEDMKYVTGYNERGWPEIDWPRYMGFDKSRGITSISRTDGLPERWDRDGGMRGNNFSDVSDGQTYTYEEKSIPYLRNERAHYTGKFRGDTYFDKIDAIAEGNLERLNTLLKKEGVAELDRTGFQDMAYEYQDFLNEVKKSGIQETATYGLKGWAAGLGDGKYTGGASQIVTPLSGRHLVKLGVIIYE